MFILFSVFTGNNEEYFSNLTERDPRSVFVLHFPGQCPFITFPPDGLLKRARLSPVNKKILFVPYSFQNHTVAFQFLTLGQSVALLSFGQNPYFITVIDIIMHGLRQTGHVLRFQEPGHS